MIPQSYKEQLLLFSLPVVSFYLLALHLQAAWQGILGPAQLPRMNEQKLSLLPLLGNPLECCLISAAMLVPPRGKVQVSGCEYEMAGSMHEQFTLLHLHTSPLPLEAIVADIR